MPYDEQLAARVRQRLSNLSPVEEKQMMGGLAFMLNDKFCISVMKNGILCRVDPAIRDGLLKKEGCVPMEMNHREMPGYVRVHTEVLANEPDLEYWINLCLEFNPKASSSKR